jgi:hypothetical protein
MNIFSRTILDRICRAPEGEGGGGAAVAGGGAGAPGGGGGDPAAAAAAAAAAGASNNGGTNAGGDWLASLDEGGRTLAQTKGWKSPVDAVKGYSELERLVGTSVKIPGKDAKPEEVAQFYAKLGRPESADKYVLPKPANGDYSDADKQFQAKLLPALHEAGVTQSQVEKLAPVWNAIQGEFNAQRDERAAKFPEEATAELTKAWGGEAKFKENMDLANRFTRAVFGDQVGDWTKIRLEDGTFLGDNPFVAKAFAAFGRKMQEEGALPAGNSDGSFNGASAADASRELQGIYDAAKADAKHPYNDNKHPEHQATLDKVMRLTTIVAGGGNA